MAEFSTNPGDRSVTELEREVDRERERVSATIDELQARASVGSLVDQLVKAVGENGGEVSRNLGRSLRDNPLAALLTGVGLAWLMAGSGRPRDEARDWEDPDSDDLPLRARSRFCRGADAQRVLLRKRRRGSRGRTRSIPIALSSPRKAACASALPTLPAGLARGSPKRLRVCASAPPRLSHAAGAGLHSGRRHDARGRRRCPPSRRRRASERCRDGPLHAPRPRHSDRGSAARRRGNRDGPGSRRRRGAPALAGRGSDVR